MDTDEQAPLVSLTYREPDTTVADEMRDKTKITSTNNPLPLNSILILF